MSFTSIMKIQQALHFVRSKTERNGDTMLIQHASSHYGQALLTIALGEGYSVYTIENHKEEIEFIQTHFPQVGIQDLH